MSRIRTGVDGVLEVAGLDAHEIDIAGLAIDFCADEEIAQGIEKAAFFLAGGVGGGAHGRGVSDGSSAARAEGSSRSAEYWTMVGRRRSETYAETCLRNQSLSVIPSAASAEWRSRLRPGSISITSLPEGPRAIRRVMSHMAHMEASVLCIFR